MSPTIPNAVLFDCDGVLVDSEPIADKVLVADLASYGLILGPDQVTEMFTGGTLKGVEQSARKMGAGPSGGLAGRDLRKDLREIARRNASDRWRWRSARYAGRDGDTLCRRLEWANG